MDMVSILARSGDRALPSLKLWENPRMLVSILARSGDRALPSDHVLHQSIFQFQSSPGLVTGRYFRTAPNSAHRARFNPRPVW